MWARAGGAERRRVPECDLAGRDLAAPDGRGLQGADPSTRPGQRRRRQPGTGGSRPCAVGWKGRMVTMSPDILTHPVEPKKPRLRDQRVTLAHGGGGQAMHELVQDMFV